MTYAGSYEYTGTDPTLIALEADAIAELLVAFPISPDDITQDQYNVWLGMAYYMRHIWDSLSSTPFE